MIQYINDMFCGSSQYFLSNDNNYKYTIFTFNFIKDEKHNSTTLKYKYLQALWVWVWESSLGGPLFIHSSTGSKCTKDLPVNFLINKKYTFFIH